MNLSFSPEIYLLKKPNQEYLDLLGQLSEVNLELWEAEEVFKNMDKHPYYVYVAKEMIGSSRIIGTTTLFVEQKMLHGGRCVGHIEDVVVDKDWRGKGIGESLVKKAIEKAKRTDCYKIILDCTEEVAPFYEKLGFKKHNTGMRLDLIL